jgi:hypothetical protein
MASREQKCRGHTGTGGGQNGFSTISVAGFSNGCCMPAAMNASSR